MFGARGERRKRLKFRGGRFKPPMINRLIPNALTIAALCAGLTSIRFGMLQRWDLAIFAIVVAGIFDGLDGRAARLLGGTSKFGAELDSLSDFVSFGAAPAVVVYMATLYQIGGVGWTVALIFATCCALRLARFNTMLGDPNPPPWAGSYFVGVPAPAGAGLAILPLMATIEFGHGFFDRPAVNAVVLVGVAALEISRIPTFSLKKLHIRPSMALPLFMLVVVIAAGLASEPFLTFICVGAAYIASIPLSIFMQGQAKRHSSGATAAPAPPPEAADSAQGPSPHGDGTTSP
ncbi:MAG TPA: phosphatidylcholine/phosphatidylserine synthase [Alphaproteobacteria bacterium]|nr:phosphatidylcholine/phosphatidylserine synthase [Alphaproteobacteria bacterium]